MAGRDHGPVLAKDLQQRLRLVRDADDVLQIEKGCRSFQGVKEAEDRIQNVLVDFAGIVGCLFHINDLRFRAVQQFPTLGNEVPDHFHAFFEVVHVIVHTNCLIFARLFQQRSSANNYTNFLK